MSNSLEILGGFGTHGSVSGRGKTYTEANVNGQRMDGSQQLNDLWTSLTIMTDVRDADVLNEVFYSSAMDWKFTLLVTYVLFIKLFLFLFLYFWYIVVILNFYF